MSLGMAIGTRRLVEKRGFRTLGNGFAPRSVAQGRTMPFFRRLLTRSS